MLRSENFKGASDAMPSTVKMATKEPAICDLEKVVGRTQIVAYVEFELIRMSALVSVGGNLNNSQVQFIASNLVTLFPNESLADFKLCFERGCIGQYGEIFRMDGIVLRKWMEQYLDEKYQVIEDELMKEKEEIYKRHQTNPDDIAHKYINEMLDNLRPDKKVVGITQQEIIEEGQERPKALKHPSTPASLIEQRELHNRWIRECFDPYTGKKNENYVDEETWLGNLQKD